LSRLVDEVDRLVGQVAILDVLRRQLDRGDDRGVGDPDPVVGLVAILDAADDVDGVVDRGLVDADGLEAAEQRLVLRQVLLVLVRGGRADTRELAAREHGLQHVAGVERALARARADDRVQLVDEQDHLGRGEHAGDDGLEPLLEVTSVTGTREELAEVECEDPARLHAVGHVAERDPHRQSLDDRGLTDARQADEHRVVLRAAAENL
jgi:hypothetical protein